jgi:hypothetical protein
MKFAAAIHATTDFGDDRIPFPDALAMVADCGFSDVMLLARRGAGGILRRGETPPGALINLLESDLGIVSGLLQRNGITPRIVFASGVNPAEPEPRSSTPSPRRWRTSSSRSTSTTTGSSN